MSLWSVPSVPMAPRLSWPMVLLWRRSQTCHLTDSITEETSLQNCPGIEGKNAGLICSSVYDIAIYHLHVYIFPWRKFVLWYEWIIYLRYGRKKYFILGLTKVLLGYNDILTLTVQRPSYLGITWSISLLLMPWLLAWLEHQQPWYWLCKIGKSVSYNRKDFNYLWHINVEALHKISIYIYVYLFVMIW